MAYLYREEAFWPARSAAEKRDRAVQTADESRSHARSSLRDACVECGRDDMTVAVWDDLGRVFCRRCWFGLASHPGER